MKTLTITLLLMMLSIIYLNAESIELTGDKSNLKINGSFEIEEITSRKAGNEKYNILQIPGCVNTGIYGEAELPAYTKLISLPETGNFKVSEIKYEFEEIDIKEKIIPFGWQDDENTGNDFYLKDKWFPQEIVTISRPNIMRGNRFTQITVAAVQYNPFQNKLRILKDIDIKFNIDYLQNENPLTKTRRSNSFTNIVEKNIYGAEVLRNTDGGQYLFICPDDIAAILQPLLRWKEKLGYKTRIASISETGSTNDEIKSYLQNAYDNWETPPEYVVLVGDVSGAYQVPAFYVTGYLTPWDVSDHNYTLLDGEDYFPDILIGRLSYQDQMQLHTIISKIINYERNPIVEYDWMKRALMISFVDNWQYHSPRETVMAVREKLLDFEFTCVDTFIAPYQWGVYNLINMINTGYSFVNYRGAGSPSVWGGNYGPMFETNDILLLDNGFMLPMITSITCGGGDFAYTGNPSNFGETWLNAGSPSVPKGAIAFIGPSERDTQTSWNNCIDLGIYQGITQEDLFRCGEMLLRGKMELYINYPNNHAWGNALNSDQFYFYVYNLLGDPGLQIWTDTPQNIELEVWDYYEGMNYVSAHINTEEGEKDGFIIAITNSDSLITTGITDGSGNVNIPCDLDFGSYSVTASKYGYIPQTEEFSIIEGNYLGLLDYNLSEDPISGDSLNIELTLKNFGTLLAENVTINLDTEEDRIEVISPEITTDEISADELFICDFQIQICEEWYDGFTSNIFVKISSSFGEKLVVLSIKYVELHAILIFLIVPGS